MKKNLIKGSMTFAALATGMAVFATVAISDEASAIVHLKLLATAGYMGLLSISLFFGALISPNK